MKIKLIGHTPDQDLVVENNNPWQGFKKELLKNNFEIVSGDLEENLFDALIVNSHSPKALKRASQLNIKKENIFLIYWEPSVTNPKIHMDKVRKLYGNIYTPSTEWKKRLGGEYFFWPQGKIVGNLQSLDTWKKRKNKVVMILANKHSASKGQNYSLRRTTDQIKDNFGNYLVDLYGQNWNRGMRFDLIKYFAQLIRTPIKQIDIFSGFSLGKKQKNYYGYTKEKNKISSKYKINLIIENSAEYVSEKLFEAHMSQNIVVYVGASLESESINDKIAIQCESNINELSKLINHLLSLPDKDQYKIMKLQWQIAKIESRKRFNELVLRNLANSILKKIERI